MLQAPDHLIDTLLQEDTPLDIEAFLDGMSEIYIRAMVETGLTTEDRAHELYQVTLARKVERVKKNIPVTGPIKDAFALLETKSLYNSMDYTREHGAHDQGNDEYLVAIMSDLNTLEDVIYKLVTSIKIDGKDIAPEVRETRLRNAFSVFLGYIQSEIIKKSEHKERTASEFLERYIDTQFSPREHDRELHGERKAK